MSKEDIMIADILDGGQKEMFNIGVDASLKVVSQYESATTQPFLKSLMKEIISKLKKLKK